MNLLVCSECHGGATAEHRLCVAAPCGHILHESCATFLKQQAKLMRRGQPINPHEPPAVVQCPDCGEGVHTTHLMFLDATALPEDERQRRAAHLQRKLVMRLAEGLENKREVQTASASCAARFQEINGLKSALQALQAALENLDQFQVKRGPIPMPGVLHDEGSAITNMTPQQLSWHVRDLHGRLTVEKAKLDSAQKLLVSKKRRYLSLKSEYDAQRVAKTKDRNFEKRAVINVDPVISKVAVSAPPPAAAANTYASSDVIDVDASDSDSDVEIVAVVPRVVVVKPEAAATMRPLAMRSLPSYDVGSGRSLLDFPRVADATFQPVITRYL